tara:strand:- start:393 stop:560 length:168 start_codon:yes stop_codon:yes gene_type:complete
MQAVEAVVGRMVKGGRIKCPQCGDTRKNKSQKTMGVTINGEEPYIIVFIVEFQEK